MQKFPSKVAFQSHRDRSHNDGKGKHKCPYCETTFYLKNYLDQHLKDFHPETLGKFRMSNCPHCSSKFKSQTLLWIHLRQEHAAEIVNCKACERSFASDKYLHSHIKTKHPDETNALFGCPHCSKTFSSKRLLLYHEDFVHHEKSLDIEKPYGCSVIHCTKRFRDKWCSVRHSTYHVKHNESIEEKLKAKSDGKAVTKPSREKKDENELLKDEDRFQCQTCGKLINAKARGKHLQKHQEERMDHVCKLCYKKYPTEGKLRAHERKHRDYSVQCPIENCKKMVKSRVLKLHINSVHYGKRHECSQCGKSFSAPGDLMLHVRGTHQGIKMECCVCGKDFNRSSDRNRHERQVHSFERNKSEVNLPPPH